jgi:hypothetical protein
MVVVQMQVHAGDCQVMVIVLDVRDALSHGAIVVVVHIPNVGYAMRALVLPQCVLRMPAANQIAHGLRARGVAMLFGQLVQNDSQLGFNRNGDAFHAQSFQQVMGIHHTQRPLEIQNEHLTR